MRKNNWKPTIFLGTFQRTALFCSTLCSLPGSKSRCFSYFQPDSRRDASLHRCRRYWRNPQLNHLQDPWHILTPEYSCGTLFGKTSFFTARASPQSVFVLIEHNFLISYGDPRGAFLCHRTHFPYDTKTGGALCLACHAMNSSPLRLSVFLFTLCLLLNKQPDLINSVFLYMLYHKADILTGNFLSLLRKVFQKTNYKTADRVVVL